MSDPRLPAIPSPSGSVDSLFSAVLALKQALEMLTGQTGSGIAVVPVALQNAIGSGVVGSSYIQAINSSVDSLTTYINDQISQASGSLENQIETAQVASNAAFSELNGLIDTEALARQAGDQSLVSLINTLTSSSGGSSIEAALANETLLRVDGDSALAVSVSSLTTTVNSNKASADSSIATLTTTDTALSGQISTLTTNVSNNAAAITAEGVARSAQDSALASQITTVSAVAGRQRVFSQSSVPTASGVGDLWIDTANQNLIEYWDGTVWLARDDQRITVNAAAISTESTARATADTAITAQITSLTSTVSGNTASITSEASTRATADTALAGQISSLSTTVSNNTAAISSEAVTRAAADGALSSQITSVSAQSSAGTANGKFQVAATSTNNGASAEFAVKVSADGATYSETGMRLQAFSDGTSRVVFDTTQFLIRSGTSAYIPFAVAGSALIANALIVPNSNVTGLGSLATQSSITESQFSGTLANAKVAGLGAFATASQITPGNIATYIQTAAITDAYIGSISASKVTVSQLSAFTANLGTVTAGVARSSDSRFVIDFTSGFIKVFDESGVLRAHIGNLSA